MNSFSDMAHGEISGAGCTGTTQLMEDHHNRSAQSDVVNRGPYSRFQSSRFACLRCCGNLLKYLIRLRNTPEELEQRCKSKEIDKFLEKEKQTFRRQVRTSLFVFYVDFVNLICFIGQTITVRSWRIRKIDFLETNENNTWCQL